MADPLTHLRQRSSEQWLIADRAERFTDWAEQRSQELQATNSGTPPSILLTEADPIKFLSSFVAAIAAGCPVFLGNPHWTATEQQQALTLTQPTLLWGSDAADWQPQTAAAVQPGWIMIPTGGSSGQLRFAIHTWQTLSAAAEGFQQYFQCDRVNSCCVLPLYHVSGLMQFVRSLLTGGKLAVLPFKSMAAGSPPAIDPSEFFLSLVPTQLQRLLQSPQQTNWLRQFHTVFLGGAPAWAALLDQAQQQGIRLSPTYGMTETAAQIATLKPAAFLQSDRVSPDWSGRSVGQVLPHAQVTIAAGRVQIRARSLALGYYPPAAATPEHRFFEQLTTDDLGYFDAEGNLHITGRASRKIITGGENVFPEEVEAALRASQLVDDVCVIGLPDRQWGEAVTAVYVARHPRAAEQLPKAIADQLSKFKQPKHYVAVRSLPRNAQGKLNYAQIQQLAAAALQLT